MHSSVWGGSYWFMLHSLSFAYEEENKQDFKNVILTIGKVLPCSVCRGHFAKLIRKNPIKYNSKEELTKWLFDRHNYLNKLLRKWRKPDYNKVKTMYPSTLNPKKLRRFFNFFSGALKLRRFNNYKKIFTLVATTWPDPTKRQTIAELIAKPEFTKASKPKDLKHWYQLYFKPAIIQDTPLKTIEENEERKVKFAPSPKTPPKQGIKTKLLRKQQRLKHINKILSQYTLPHQKIELRKRRKNLINHIANLQKQQ